VTAAVWKGQQATVALGKTGALVVAVPAGQGSKLSTQVVRTDPLVAPIAKGQPLGVLRVSHAGQVMAELPLVALQGVEQAGVLGRAWDALRLWIK